MTEEKNMNNFMCGFKEVFESFYEDSTRYLSSKDFGVACAGFILLLLILSIPMLLVAYIMVSAFIH